MNDMTEGNRNNWILGVLSSLMVAAIIGLFTFVIKVSNDISVISTGQNEINNAILDRLENIENSFVEYVRDEAKRTEAIQSDLADKTANRYTAEDAKRDIKILELQTQLEAAKLKLWVELNYVEERNYRKDTE